MDRRAVSKLLLGGAFTAAVESPLAWAAQGTGRLTTEGAAAGPKFSCMLWTLERSAPFDRCLEVVAQAGYQGVELVGEFQKWSPAETQRVLGRIHTFGLEVDAASGLKTGFAVAGQTEAFLGELKQQLGMMQTLGCKRVILLSGAVDGKISAAQQRDIALDNLARAADLAAAAQVEILIEPIDVLENPTSYLRSVAEGFSLVKTLNRPNVKVLYDLYHEQRGAGNLIEKLQANLDWVGLIHVADVPGRHEPGTGEIDYGVIYRKLAERRYHGWIAMEFYPTGEATASLRTARLMAQAAWRT